MIDVIWRKEDNMEMRDLYTIDGPLKEKLTAIIDGIKAIDENAMEEAKQRQLYLAKPPGSLGKLEDISVQLAGITGKVTGNKIEKKAILVMSGDNGIVEEGVAVAPQSVTKMQTINMTRGITGVGAMAKGMNIDLLVTDVGVKEPIDSALYTDQMERDGRLASKIVYRKIRAGSRNFHVENALTEEEVLTALLVGCEASFAAKKAGIDVIGIGEMGIGNSTTSAVILGALLEQEADKVTGRGGGLNDQGLAKKLAVIDEGIRKQRGNDPLTVLQAFGGLEMCAMAGAFIGGAAAGMPVVIDGFISMVAALVASRLAPESRNYMFASHKSFEKGYEMGIDALGLQPMFHLDMRLGEGTGCPMAFSVLEASCAVMNNMKTFGEGSIDDGYLEEIREGNLF